MFSPSFACFFPRTCGQEQGKRGLHIRRVGQELLAHALNVARIFRACGVIALVVQADDTEAGKRLLRLGCLQAVRTCSERGEKETDVGPFACQSQLWANSARGVFER